MLKKITSRLMRIFFKSIQMCRIFFYRAISSNVIHGNPTYFKPVHCVGVGKVTVHNCVNFGVFPSPFFLSTCAYIEARNRSSTITIGAGTWVNNNFCAIAEHTSITIGENCLIGTSVEIMDSDFHGLAVGDRLKSLPLWARPVTIGNNVFIGSNARILKGVTIGDGAVIASGAVVTKDIPPDTIAGGNPARPIKAIS